ncbi:hypothetical protein EIP86_007081 [Pleurotus ostreatoroseus]|nr:hypothetical protein EIP86_007081 [Pleurotus ostreatoroseus]
MGIFSETGSADWEYFTIPVNVHAHFLPHSDGNSELIVTAGEYHMVSVVNCEIDGVPAYNTHDLLAPHPTKPGYWKVFGRTDDQIMHSTGEKTNPGPLEAILNQDPHVQSAVIFGRGRFNAGVLIDPTEQYKFDPTDVAKLAAFRNLVWPTIEKMNEFAPQHSRIFKEMITVASPTKPFTYTAKNTPRRHFVIDEYKDEIDVLYDAVEESTQADLVPPSVWTVDTTTDYMRAVVSRVVERELRDLDDLFPTWIRNSVLHALRDTTGLDTRIVPSTFVYQNPTIASLAYFVLDLASCHSSDGNAGGGRAEAAVQAMQRMIEKYSTDFPVHTPGAGGGETDLEGEVVLVTGTTGGLGASLLDALVRSPEVARVYAVNRAGPVPILQRQLDVLNERGFDGAAVVGSPKVVLLEAKTEEDGLGLASEVYNEVRDRVLKGRHSDLYRFQICDTISLIIHNAWPVNFNMSLSSFEPSVQGVRSLIDLALSSPHASPPKLLFISSIGVLRHLDHSKPALEEAVDLSVAVGTGYSESKLVSEKLLAVAAEQTALRTAVIRLGQITGTSAGAWKSAEWLPSLVKSSVYLGCLPELDKTIAWIPVDTAARAVFEMRASLSTSSLRFFHLAHPRSVRWMDVMGPLATSLGLRTVPYDEWIMSLASSGENVEATKEVDVMQKNPALKILQFFKDAGGGTSPEAMGIPALDVTQAEGAAPALGKESLPQLGAEDAGRWLKYWKGIGFL